MNIFKPFIEPAIQIAKVAFCVALFGAGFYLGQIHVQAKWDAENAARTQAENSAILTRMKNNERIATQQENDRLRIEKAHHDELAKVRAAIARAPGLRVGPAICSGFASSAETKGDGSSDAADSRGGVVREDVRRDIDALKVRVEEAFAAGRACQAELVAAGLAP